MSVLVLDTIKNPNERYNKYNKFGMSDKGNLFVTTWMNNYNMKCKKKLHLRITYIISKNGIYYKTINNKICRIKDKFKQIKDFKSSFKHNICEFIYAYIEHSPRSEEIRKAILRIFLDFLSQSVDYKLLADAMKPVESKLVNIFHFNSFIFKLIDILDLFKYFNNNCKAKSIRKLLFSILNINPNSTSDELRLWINKLRIILQSYYHWSKTIGIKDINCLRTLINAGIKYNFDCDSLMQFNIRQQRFIVKTMGETVFTNKFINYLKDIHNKSNNKYLDGTYQYYLASIGNFFEYRQMLPKLKLVRRIWQNFDYNILKGNFNEIIENRYR